MAAGTYRDLWKLSGFRAFLWAQFLGALNDNIYKMAVSLLAISVGTLAGTSGAHISLVGALFILPYFLFSGYAGYLADRYSKRTILVATKVLEIVAMALGILAFASGDLGFMLAVLFLMALQSAFFSPAKYGILPEMLPERDLSRANGLLEMSTFLAIILGTSAGGLIFGILKERLWVVGALLTAIAAVGTLKSLGIPRVPASGAREPFRLNPFSEIGSGARELARDRPLALTVAGISYFWFLGALLQMCLLLFGKELMGLDDASVGLLGTALALGIGCGSIAAGKLSGDKIELGLVPLGSIGIGLFSFLLSLSSRSFALTGAALFLLGFAGGLFIVPLNALLQQRSGREEKGRLIATNNFFNTAGILLASGVLWFLRDGSGLLPDAIVALASLFTLAATGLVLAVLPESFVRAVLWTLAHAVYRIRTVGAEHLPARGPALIVGNLASAVDGLLIGASTERPVRLILDEAACRPRPLRWFLRLARAIPVSAASGATAARSLERVREELERGHLVALFAEGAPGGDGGLPFKLAIEKMAGGLGVPVVAAYLDRARGGILSGCEGGFLRRRPARAPRPVTLFFAPPLPATATAAEVRRRISELAGAAADYRRGPYDLLHLRFAKSARRRWSSLAMADSTGREISFGRALVTSLLLARWLQRDRRGETMVGVLLPAGVAAGLANAACLFAGKVPVNLNFTAGPEALASAIDQCGIRTVFTSRQFVSRAKIDFPLPGPVYLEELFPSFSAREKLAAYLAARFLPCRLLQARLAGSRPDPRSLATVIFSSGSTGAPKGVMLTHHNIVSNVESFSQIFSFTAADRMLGPIPFFHSFGFTVTLWFPLIGGLAAVYHANPADAKAIGELAARYRPTVICSTPTFYAAYTRRCSAEEFSSLRYAICGAEKLREVVAASFREKYGFDILEGYGCTEMGPVVSVNVPDAEIGGVKRIGSKPGTVGRPIPGVTAMVVDPVTEEPLPPGAEGLLWVKGPSRMVGYLGQPQKTAEVFRDGWYVTGDIAAIDEDGFITITDRLSRFSKIGGEMVPHVRIEEAINSILGDHACAVTAIEDEQRGERLVALYSRSGISPELLWSRLQQSALPKLWIPKKENIYRLEELPVLGSGKIDFREVKRIAREKAGRSGERSGGDEARGERCDP